MRLIASLFTLCLCATSLAQIPSVTELEKTPVPGAGHSYIENNIETVNPADGSLSIKLNVPLPPSRGINLPFALTYNSSSMFNGLGSEQVATPFARGGWSYSVPALSAQLGGFAAPEDVSTFGTVSYVNCTVFSDYVFQSPTGSRQNLGLTTWWDANSYCAQVGAEGPVLNSTVGSYQALTTPYTSNGDTANPVVVIDADGTAYSFNAFQSGTGSAGAEAPSTVTDSHGNTITINTFAPSGFTYTDSIGRTALAVGSVGGSPDTITVSGLSSPYQVSWSTITSAPTNPEVYVPEPLTPAGTCPGTGNYPGSGTSTSTKTVSSIQLPNGQSYTFLYDSTYGVVSRITYPWGGYVQYVWGFNPQSSFIHIPYETAVPIVDGNGYPTGQTYDVLGGYCTYQVGTLAIQHRYVSYTGAGLDQQQDFSYSTTWDGSIFGKWDTKQTTVTTTDLDTGLAYSTVYTYGSTVPDFQPNSNAWAWGQIPIETQVQYKGANGALLEIKNQQWDNDRLLAKQQNQLDNGMLSETDWSYNSNEMTTEKDEYDYHSNTMGTTSPTLEPVS